MHFVTYHVVDSFPGGHQTYSYSSKIIEIIGDVYFVFNFYEQASLICDANYSCGLRCYNDAFLGHFETGIAPECTYTYVSVEEPEIYPLRFYPNPTADRVILDVELKQPYTIAVINVNGKVCSEFKDLDSISLDKMPAGMYFLQIIEADGKHFQGKVLKYGS